MNKWKSLLHLWPYFKQRRGLLILSLCCSFVYLITGALIPYTAGMITTAIVEQLKTNGTIDFSFVLAKISIFLVVCLLNVSFQYCSSATMTLVIQKAMKSLRQTIAQKIDELPLSYVDQHKKGDLLSRLTNDVDMINNACQQGLLSLFNSIFTVIFALAMMLYLNVTLTLLALVMIPLIYIFTKYVMKRSQPFFVGRQKALGDLNGYIQEQLEGFDIVKLYGQEDDVIDSFAAKNQTLCHNIFNASKISLLLMPLMNLAAYTGYVLVAITGGIFCIKGVLAIGQLQAFIQYIWQVSQPLSQVGQLSNMFQGALAGLERIDELLDVQPLVDVETTASFQDKNGEVIFNDVSFSYTDEPLIEHLNLHVHPGETVAIVGPTGAGKTTLVNLLMRFYPIKEGTLLLDGCTTQEVSLHDWRNKLGMVLQDPWLIKGTVMDNLKFSQDHLSDDDVMTLMKQASIHEEIMRLPAGYDTELSADGYPLSQGQKQLITIARAMLKNPEVLILDEATSSVDTRLEKKIQHAMDEMMKNRTSFVIAHRLSTIQEATTIIVLDHGKIIEHGNHHTLLEKNGVYADLYYSQFQK